MEKKLAVIVENNEEITTGAEDRKMCSSACDVVENLCSLESHDTRGDGVSLEQPKTEVGFLCEVEFGYGR